MPKTVVSSWDITPGFVQAVQAYSEYLQGDRSEENWGGAAAREFLNDIGATLPQNPISQDDLAILKALMFEAEYVRNNPTKTTVKKKQISKIDLCNQAINKYCEAELGLSFDRNATPGDYFSNIVPDFGAALKAAQSIYTRPPTDLLANRNAYLALNNPKNDYEQPWDQMPSDAKDVLDSRMDETTWEAVKPDALGDMP